MEELQSLIQSVSDASYAEKLGAFLDKHYGDIQTRPYHNWEHIHQMMDLFRAHQSQLHDPEAVLLTIYFHDVIYQPLYTNNELQSAERAQEWLSKTDLPMESIRKVYEYILSTKTHANHTEDQDLDYLLDFDLSILGSEPDRYRLYSEQIRQEFHEVPELMYREGRKRILGVFLAMPSIFKTEAFQHQYEQQARSNIEEEIKHLSEAAI